MDPLRNKYTYFQRLKHQFQARRDVPFRRKFFVGYDLHGNTYWEFTIDGNMQRLRRKMDPYKPLLFQADYHKTVPPQWLQWLRRTRYEPPTLEELINDQVRQAKLKVLAQQADARWESEKLRLESEQRMKLQAELDRAEEEQKKYRTSPKKAEIEKDIEKGEEIGKGEEIEKGEEADKASDTEKASADPWAQADASKDSDPISSAQIRVRR